MLEAVDVSTCKDGRVYLSSGRALVKEIEKYLRGDYRQLTQSSKDSSFSVAFNNMADSFLVDNPGQKKRAEESLAVSTLYNYYFKPCNKKKICIIKLNLIWKQISIYLFHVK